MAKAKSPKLVAAEAALKTHTKVSAEGLTAEEITAWDLKLVELHIAVLEAKAGK